MLQRYQGGQDRATFALLPAIDLVGGRVVRLRQGDFDRETTYADDAAAVAEGFAGEGADWLHIVDLDGARRGAPAQTAIVRGIVDRVGDRARSEVAGGLRTDAAVAEALDTGAARAVVGTAALRDPEFAARLVERHGPERIAVSIDVRGGLALGEGWRAGAAGIPVEEAIEGLASVGVTTFEVTAIDRDGLLGGPDLELLRRVIRLGRGDIIASGGISSVDDIVAVRELGCSGAIVGRALYEGRFTLPEAFAALAS